MFLDGAFAARFRSGVNNCFMTASQQVLEMFGGAVKFLSADDQAETGDFF